MVLNVDPVIVEFAIIVETVMAFPTIVEKVIILVERNTVLIVDPVIVVFTVISLPVIVKKVI